MNNHTRAMVLNGQVRITFIVAIILTIFLMAIIPVSNPSMFVAAKGGTLPYRYIWEKVSEVSTTSRHGDVVQVGGGNIPVNLPRFDREASYFRIAEPDRSWNVLRFNEGLGGMLYSSSSLLPPNIQGYQQVYVPVQVENSLIGGEGSDILITGSKVIPSSTSYPLGFGAGSSGASGVTSGGTLTSFKTLEPYQNIVTRHGGVVQASSTPQYPLIYDYNNQDHPYGSLPVSVLGVGSRGLPSIYAVKVLPGSEIYSIGDPGNMDADNFRGLSFGGYQQVSCDQGTYRICVIDAEGYTPVSYDSKPTYNQISQNEEALFQENLKEALIHRAL